MPPLGPAPPRSLNKGRGGGLQNGRGGCEVLPLRKGVGGGGAGRSFSHAEGGGGAQIVLGYVLYGSLMF